MEMYREPADRQGSEIMEGPKQRHFLRDLGCLDRHSWPITP